MNNPVAFVVALALACAVLALLYAAERRRQFKEAVLQALACGVERTGRQIRDRVSFSLAREVSLTAVYMELDALETRGVVEVRMVESGTEGKHYPKALWRQARKEGQE